MTLSFGKSSLLSGFFVLSIALLFVACSSGNSKKETTDTLKVDKKENKHIFRVDRSPQLFNTGKKIFDGNCRLCHTVTNEVRVGPGLQGIFERRSLEWVIKWTKNSAKVIASGDPYARMIFRKFNKAVMQIFIFPDDQMKALMFYIANPQGKPYTALDDLPKPKPFVNDSTKK